MNCYSSLYTNLSYRIIFLTGDLARRSAYRYAGQEYKDRPNNGIFKEMVE